MSAGGLQSDAGRWHVSRSNWTLGIAVGCLSTGTSTSYLLAVPELLKAEWVWPVRADAWIADSGAICWALVLRITIKPLVTRVWSHIFAPRVVQEGWKEDMLPHSWCRFYRRHINVMDWRENTSIDLECGCLGSGCEEPCDSCERFAMFMPHACKAIMMIPWNYHLTSGLKTNPCCLPSEL